VVLLVPHKWDFKRERLVTLLPPPSKSDADDGSMKDDDNANAIRIANNKTEEGAKKPRSEPLPIDVKVLH
jgi:hypothetical protein